MKDFIQDQRFDRVGVFTYFQEDGTEAATMDGQVDDLEVERQAEIMQIQAEYPKRKMTYIGKVVPILSMESLTSMNGSGRMETQALEVDGKSTLLVLRLSLVTSLM